ncbi:glycosyl transferase [Desulfopila sp. IMCC35006]|nr:glycosyl transferase [Desulfopila sp. IMCC35006]
MQKGVNGATQTVDPFCRRRAARAGLVAILSGGTGTVICLFLHWLQWFTGGDIFIFPTVILMWAIIGGLAVLALFRREKFGVTRSIIRNHARWLVPGESVLILNVPVDLLPIAMVLLRECGDTPPALFVLHAGRERRLEARGQTEKLSPTQILEHARRHASEQQVDQNPCPNTGLLKRIRQTRHWLRQVCVDLAAASRLEQKATPAADWILDNEYILEENARDVLLNLPRRFFQQLPSLASEPYRGLPCIYGLAKNLVGHMDLHLDRENIIAFLDAHQSVRTLTIGELWAIPQMLRIALIESIQSLAVTALADLRDRQLADFWANRLIAANRHDSNQLFAFLSELTVSETKPSPYFGVQMIGLLYDEAAALSPVQNWLERTLKTPLHDLHQRELNRQTRDQLTCGNAFTSLRHLALLDWREIFEKLNRVEQILRFDPSGNYPGMDFATRDRCRGAVEAIALAAGQPEEEIAAHVIKLAKEAMGAKGDNERRSHVVTWLIGEGRADLGQLLSFREAYHYRFLAWIYAHHTTVYFFTIGFFFTLFLMLVTGFALHPGLGAAGSSPAAFFGLLLLLVIPLSQLAIEVVNYLITRFLPPRPLAKMDFADSGIPDSCRTLVVVPMMLTDSETIRSEVEKLEIRYLANKETNLLFSLFSDYIDADAVSLQGDSLLLKDAKEHIEALNQRHENGRFFLFHRERTWSESEQKYIGWERKRGKLEDLNRFIDGTRPENAPVLIHVGNPDHLANVRFIITLDSDTQLPHATARRMVETLAHPLNQPRFDDSGRIVAGSYTIIQPRVSPTLTSTSISNFSRLFADAVGIDPYTAAISDVYQDLSGEGSYQGKGIYDVRAFSRILSGRFPENWILSHDLIEGAHVRVGLASDIELFDDFPQGYQSYAKRAHRWIRGDWQIAGWIFPRVPQADGSRGPNPLSPLNRWKIIDNLRRSLLPAASVLLLLASWLISPRMGACAAHVIGIQLVFHPLAQPFTMATTIKGLKYFDLRQLGHDILRAITDAALLPHQAAVTLDAIARVGYRRLISGRRLLQWTAQATILSGRRRGDGARRQSLFVAGLTFGSLFSIAVTCTLYFLTPKSLLLAAPWLGLWFFSPLIGWFLNLRPVELKIDRPLPEADHRLLRQVARRTWHFFSAFVGDSTSWLPPDNYQVAYQDRLAMRTSPTNIGLWMASTMGAYDSGYLTIDQVLSRLTDTMATIGRLDKYQGHLLNWYDLETLTPLEPRYVSTVDNGNLLGALWALRQGLEELVRDPLIDRKSFTGLADAGEVLKEVMIRNELVDFNHRALDALLTDWNASPSSLNELLHDLERMAADVETVVIAATNIPWAKELADQSTAWQSLAERYLVWTRILAEKSAVELALLGEAAVLAIDKDLSRAPSLLDLAQGNSDSIGLLRKIRQKSPDTCPALTAWLDRVIDAFATAQWLAGETMAVAEQLMTDIDSLASAMDMRFLYDPSRKLFAIGYNVSTSRLDGSSYDLLASESRLGSFVAIARGDVPLEHWFTLSRPYGAVGGRRVLLSWTGTMFEYLMPLLFQHSYPHSLLDKAAGDAVAIQIAYGRTHGVPWGISESAYADLDLDKTYQYKAFGVPTLGLKRGMEEQPVVAAYASLLALNQAPGAVLRNMKRLNSLGLLGDYGYFEAMDFSRQPQRDHSSKVLKHGVIVETYMAHHQGMSFLALTNFLHDNPFPRRFHSDTRVRAFEALLQERIPTLPPIHLISIRQSEPQLLAVDLVAPAGTTITTPHTSLPRALLLSNGRYGLMITNNGGGYSQWGSRELTRWRSDPTCDTQGTFCYIHEVDTDRLWSTTYHPVGGKVDGYSVDFSLDRAVFRRTDNSISCETEIIVSPEDDVEIRRITLVNHSVQARRLNLTSFAELAMAPHNADLQHPAFNKLFIQTEAVPEHDALLAWRRSRGENDPPLYVAHSLILQGKEGVKREGQAWQFETDRAHFIGRGRTLVRPMGAMQDLTGSQGFVLDPILSLRKNITLAPGGRIQVHLLLAAGAGREQVLLLLDKYGGPHDTERAMDFAWHSAQQQLQMLRIQSDDARRFQQLASHLLFPNSLLRASARRLAENHKGQAGLWPYGISGDRPMVLITISEAREIALVRQMLQAHTYLQMHGLSFDLIILNEEAGSYQQPLQERLEQLIQSHTLSSTMEQPGAIFLRSLAQIPEVDQKLLKAAASVVLVAARGPLPQQLGVPVEIPELLERLTKKHGRPQPSAPLPFMELNYFNSLGGFTPDGREYAIYLGPGTSTPAPWVNVMANPTFGTMVSETGSGFTWYGNSQRNRLTGWSNDPVLDPASEALYIRDEDSGTYWSPTATPIREEPAYRARHGAGYTVFEHNSNGIEQELTVFVPVDEKGGSPVKLQRLQLINGSSAKRRLSITYYVELTLGENRETTQMHISTHWDEETCAMLVKNHYHPEYGDRVTFVAITPEAESFSGDRTAFIGRNRSLAIPIAMELTKLSGRVGAGLDPCAALQVTFTMAPGEHRCITCMLGQAESTAQAREIVLRYREDHAVADALQKTKSWWNELLGTIEVHTPELAADLLINRWLQYQSLSCRLWGRSAFYQSGGAFGFRDQLQDVMAFCYARPEIARDQILLAASRQFTEGDVQHWWHEPAGAGIRSRISDDLLWLPYVVAHYVRTTGDTDILLAEIPFLQGGLLADDQHELFSTPDITQEHATLFEHCRRAVNRGLTAGPHGLPLMGTGDWNDGMNLVGAKGKGESVWLAWFLCDCLQGMAELATLMQQPELSQAYREKRSVLAAQVEKSAWDGAWYLRGTFDDGTPLGSNRNSEARIDSLPQSWAWLSGVADPKRAGEAMESAWHHLVHEDEGLTLLFTPPFDHSEPSPGYIRGYPPGVRENGGQYTHAALWMAMAMARQGDGERAAGLLRLLNPIEHTRDAKAVWDYVVEPYVVTADVYRLPGRIGRGGWSWYTGSAAWMYRAWIEEVLGLKVRGNRMEIDPVIPATWPRFSLNYRHDETTYAIEVENPSGCERGVIWVEMDGRRVVDEVILLERELVKHRVIVMMGQST